ncbi:MAG: hypothetical protein R6X19_08750 [Kiritimatiellia bacterium]
MPVEDRSSESLKPIPFQFLYYSGMAGCPIMDAISGEKVGRLHDISALATLPYPTVSGLEIRTPSGLKRYPWSAVKDIQSQSIHLDPAEDGPFSADFSVRRDLLRKLAVEVSATMVNRIWDIHFVYSDNQMVLAHAEIGIRGILRTLGLEKLVLLLLGALLKGPLRERFATFRHLQILRKLPDGSIHIPKRVLEMHPADLAAVLRQLSGQLRRQIFCALPDEAAAAVLSQAELRLQKALLATCKKSRRLTVQKLMQTAMKDLPPL